MNINSTILALQMMNGLKVYHAKALNDEGHFHGSYFLVKHTEELEIGTWVLVSFHDNNFEALCIMAEEEDVDFDYGHDISWVITTLENPVKALQAKKLIDKKARTKLARSRAIEAARSYVEAAGVEVSDFALEDKTDD